MVDWDTYQFARHGWERRAAVMLDEPEKDSITIDYTIKIIPEGKKSISIKVDDEYIGASGSAEGVVDRLIAHFDDAKGLTTQKVCEIIDRIFYDYEPDDSGD